MVRIKKEPLKMRVLSETDNTPNREQRRQQNRLRTSATVTTKKWTRGRLKPRIEILKLRMSMTPKMNLRPFRQIIQQLTTKLGVRK